MMGMDTEGTRDRDRSIKGSGVKMTGVSVGRKAAAVRSKGQPVRMPKARTT